MAQQTADDDEVLPFTLESPHPNTGVGAHVSIVSLDKYAGEPGVTDEGRCRWCGYDRGEASSHTEVAGVRVTCRHCDGVVYKEEP